MENIKVVEKLKKKFNISYEEAKLALEKTNWDILDAVVYLEEVGRIPKPFRSNYFSNESNDSYEESASKNDNFKEDKYTKKESLHQGAFEAICKFIDKCNNIFFKIKRYDNELINLPLTVMLVLVLFAFWIIIPSAIVALFFEIEFSVQGKNIESSKVNNVFKELSEGVRKIKEEFNKVKKNG